MFNFYKFMNRYSPVMSGGDNTPTDEVTETPDETTNNSLTQIDDIITYVMHTPGNTNPTILREKLQNMGGSEEKYGFKITIVNNTGDHITYAGQILFEDGFDDDEGAYELIPESVISFQSCASMSFDNSIPLFSYQYTIIDNNHDYNVIVSGNNLANEYGKGKHIIYATLPNAPITEDIIITVNPI